MIFNIEHAWMLWAPLWTTQGSIVGTFIDVNMIDSYRSIPCRIAPFKYNRAETFPWGGSLIEQLHYGGKSNYENFLLLEFRASKILFNTRRCMYISIVFGLYFSVFLLYLAIFWLRFYNLLHFDCHFNGISPQNLERTLFINHLKLLLFIVPIKGIGKGVEY